MKLDKDNYKPTSYDCARLIKECKVVECHREDEEAEPKLIKKKATKPKEPKKDDKKTFYCSLHGKKLTHDSDRDMFYGIGETKRKNTGCGRNIAS